MRRAETDVDAFDDEFNSNRSEEIENCDGTELGDQLMDIEDENGQDYLFGESDESDLDSQYVYSESEGDEDSIFEKMQVLTASFSFELT